MVLGAACGRVDHDDFETIDASAGGGHPGTGAVTGGGGVLIDASAVGGHPNSGGASGGTPATGGYPSDGAAPGYGGSPSDGAAPGWGGYPSDGGTTGYGGSPSDGAAPGYGGSPSDGAAPGYGGMPPDSGFGGTGTGGQDAGPYGLDTICSVWPAELCALRASCCAQSFGFDSASCVSQQTAKCQSKVTAVKAKKLYFRSEYAPKCSAALAPLLSACWFTGDQFAAHVSATATCNAVFDTLAGAGATCLVDEDCGGWLAPNGYSFCNAGKCATDYLGGGAMPCATTLTCVAGYYCTPAAKICVPGQQLGLPCSSDAECGLGAYCPSGLCAKAQAGGASCNSGLGCLSLTCEPTGHCAAVKPHVTAAECGK